MVTVIGIWEVGYTTEQMFIEDSVWKQTLSAYNVDRFIMVRSNGAELERVSRPEQFDSMEEALATTTGERVFLTPRGVEPLDSFDHPDDVVYIFGSAVDNLESYMTPNDHRIVINTPNKTVMFGCACLPQVLFSRVFK